MSLETWRNEFYPLAAEFVKERMPAIEHSILKWTGLKKENLAKHGMLLVGKSLRGTTVEGGSLWISSHNCALCQLYYDRTLLDTCAACPLSLARGGTNCGERRMYEEISPWNALTDNANPLPMLAALEEAKKY
jgi:hypothetical protein